MNTTWAGTLLPFEASFEVRAPYLYMNAQKLLTGFLKKNQELWSFPF